jgi:hypothetical protein
MADSYLGQIVLGNAGVQQEFVCMCVCARARMCVCVCINVHAGFHSTSLVLAHWDAKYSNVHILLL